MQLPSGRYVIRHGDNRLGVDDLEQSWPGKAREVLYGNDKISMKWGIEKHTDGTYMIGNGNGTAIDHAGSLYVQAVSPLHWTIRHEPKGGPGIFV
ncbi:hypothetical protein AMATHDRAFT_5630 [Amanita thiersii Skay4041]|uniref:Ricin B lectin domain-containing protein n=1 Tax=Amanita thiersii Skay4041 TaxID=703135 RepID=A0A2A9NDA0_9AGAR|nr:hypothetical protein AMATHDRAFT_5630 [Amanita thiersii Skay4041]